ncbi:MAG TPA: hypothetical protein PLP34_02380 [Chitinophagaceae bacterium]|nr:hypothetical protein [Chitinophagaceae bacterium]HNF71229.1 hypothetical protein [Chitinophagaceae bacterium]
MKHYLLLLTLCLFAFSVPGFSFQSNESDKANFHRMLNQSAQTAIPVSVEQEMDLYFLSQHIDTRALPKLKMLIKPLFSLQFPAQERIWYRDYLLVHFGSDEVHSQWLQKWKPAS